MKFICLITTLLFLNSCLIAQYQDRIDSGRPAQYFGARTVGDNVFQVQSGLLQNYQDIGRAELRPVSFNNQFRVGVSERVELRAFVDYQWTDALDPTGRLTEFDGLANTQVGFRVNLHDGADGFAFALQDELLLLDQSSEYRRQQIGNALTLAATRPLTDALSTGANLSATWAGDGSEQTSIGYTYFLIYALTDDLGSFVEVFGQLNDGATANFNGGLAYLIGDDLQLDLYAGWTKGVVNYDFFLTGGVSWRFDWRN